MQYRTLGKDGKKTSVLGFGCMRLPIEEESGKIRCDEAIMLIRKGIDNGITYVDTAWTYHRGESEVVSLLRTGIEKRSLLQLNVLLVTVNLLNLKTMRDI